MSNSISTPSFELTTSGAEQTETLAAELAATLPAGTTVGLNGPLGAGKTCFVRGLAAGLFIEPEQVCSPSFVYLVEYEGRSRRLVHADLYRLGDLPCDQGERVFESIGLDEAIDSDAVTVVEWWRHYHGPQPQRLVNVEFSIDSVEDRTIRLNLLGGRLKACGEFLRLRTRA